MNSMEGNMDSAKASGNQLLKLISQRIDQRRKQELAEELAQAPEVYEFPSTSETLEVTSFDSEVYEIPSTSEFNDATSYGYTAQQDLSHAEDVQAEPVMEVEPVSTLRTATTIEIEPEQFPAFVDEVAPAQNPHYEEALPAAESLPIEKGETDEASSEFAAPLLEIEQNYSFPDISKEYQFLDDISVPLEMDKVTEKFISDLELEGFLHPASDEFVVESPRVEETHPVITQNAPSEPRAEVSELRATPIPPPEFAAYELGPRRLSLDLEHDLEVIPDMPEESMYYELAADVPTEETDAEELDEPTTTYPLFAPKDYHGEFGTDERHFLLWQYVGGELHGTEREDLHQHILNCKDCASYVWKLTKDSIAQPASLDDPLPKPAVPLPSQDSAFNPDDWLAADKGVDRAAYVWKLASERAEANAAELAEPADQAGPIARLRGVRFSMPDIAALRSLAPRQRGIIAIGFALTVILCVAFIPTKRGNSEASDLRAQLKALEAKSEELRKEVEAGRAMRDQLLQVQKETDLVRQKYENAQGAFQKMSGEAADPAPKQQMDSFTRPAPVTFAAPPPDTHEIEAVLNDGNGQISMDTNGDIVGLPPLQGDLKQAVRAVIKDRRVDVPGVPANLAPEPGTVYSANGAARDGVMLVSPVGTMVEWTKPALSWMPVGGAVSYKLQVRNASGMVVAQGEASAGTEWTVPDPLPAGNTFSWSVTPLQANGTALFPNVHPPAARFGILSREKQDEIERVRSRYSDSNLVVGLACLKYKLFDNAAKEFRTLLESNPGSALAKKLAISPSKRFGG